MGIEKNTMIVHEQAGAGGFGDPLTREPTLVADDVAAGNITPEYAARHHGVVCDAHGRIDAAGTQRLRSRDTQ